MPYLSILVKEDKSIPEIVDSVGQKLLDQYEEQIVYLTKMKAMRRCFEGEEVT